MKQKIVLQYLILSFIAIGLLIIIAIYAPLSTINFYDKIIIGILFILSCIIGLYAAIRPRYFKKILKNGDSKSIIKKYDVTFRSHHPNCWNFSKHVIVFKNKIYCAGCLGLALGGIVSIFIMVIYVLYSVNFNFNILLIIGLTIIILVFFVSFFPNRAAIFHMSSNFFFVVSFLIITVSILEITGNIAFSLFTIVFSFLLLETRIQISRLIHFNICKNCKQDCKMF